MKINSANDLNKNVFLIFNENQSPNVSKHCKTKTRTNVKDNLNFNFNDCQLPFNNGLRTKQKEFNYLNLNPNNNNLPINDDQNNLGSFLNDLNNSFKKKSGPNINIIVFAPNFPKNNMEKENKKENLVNSKNNNISLNEHNKEKKNEINNNNNKNNKIYEENNCEKEKIDSPIKQNKSLFDSNFNLIEENCGKDDISEILKEFANLNLKSSFKENFSSSNKDNTKTYTNTGDSINAYVIDGSDKKEKIFYNMENPYAKSVYKK